MNQSIGNLIIFFMIAFLWTLLDNLTGQTTDNSALMVICFFLVWNNSQRKKKAPIKEPF